MTTPEVDTDAPASALSSDSRSIRVHQMRTDLEIMLRYCRYKVERNVGHSTIGELENRTFSCFRAQRLDREHTRRIRRVRETLPDYTQTKQWEQDKKRSERLKWEDEQDRQHEQVAMGRTTTTGPSDAGRGELYTYVPSHIPSFKPLGKRKAVDHDTSHRDSQHTSPFLSSLAMRSQVNSRPSMTPIMPSDDTMSNLLASCSRPVPPSANRRVNRSTSIAPPPSLLLPPALHNASTSSLENHLPHRQSSLTPRQQTLDPAIRRSSAGVSSSAPLPTSYEAFWLSISSKSLTVPPLDGSGSTILGDSGGTTRTSGNRIAKGTGNGDAAASTVTLAHQRLNRSTQSLTQVSPIPSSITGTCPGRTPRTSYIPISIVPATSPIASPPPPASPHPSPSTASVSASPTLSSSYPSPSTYAHTYEATDRTATLSINHNEEAHRAAQVRTKRMIQEDACSGSSGSSGRSARKNRTALGPTATFSSLPALPPLPFDDAPSSTPEFSFSTQPEETAAISTHSPPSSSSILPLSSSLIPLSPCAPAEGLTLAAPLDDITDADSSDQEEEEEVSMETLELAFGPS